MLLSLTMSTPHAVLRQHLLANVHMTPFVILCRSSFTTSGVGKPGPFRVTEGTANPLPAVAQMMMDKRSPESSLDDETVVRQGSHETNDCEANIGYMPMPRYDYHVYAGGWETVRAERYV